MAASSLRALLAASVDYAGMFPPCSLDLEPALEKQASYVRSADNWMLGAFVLPVTQFEAAEEHLSLFDSQHRLRISALGPKTNSAAEFKTTLAASAEMIRTFTKRHADFATIEQLEMAVPEGVSPSDLDSIAGDLNLRIFWEAPADAARTMIASLAGSVFGFKLRTGGVTPDAFPTSMQIASVLVAAAKHRLPIKFTAGLHHPVRQFRDEVNAKMHGFLNVLGAAVMAFQHGWDINQTGEMLDDEEPGAFQFDERSFAWRDWKIDTRQIAEQRRFVASFGSCSFDEPREDLQALHLYLL